MTTKIDVFSVKIDTFRSSEKHIYLIFNKLFFWYGVGINRQKPNS